MRLDFLIAFQFITLVALTGAATGGEPSSAAHAIAEKFAADEAQKPAPQPAPKAAPVVAPGAQKSTAAEEKEMLDAARREAETRKAAVQAADTQQPPPQPAPAPAAAKPVTPPAQHMQIRVEAKVNTAPAAAPSAPRDTASPRASVLVVLTDHAEKHPSLASSDPVICLGEQCYVSSGADKEASVLPRVEALSTKNTITNGAGACKGKTRCVFRGVPLSPDSDLQIVDLGIVKHDRREAVAAKADASCHVEEGDLICDNPATAPDYRIWIVPETVAAAAGSSALEGALADELPEENVARDGDK